MKPFGKLSDCWDRITKNIIFHKGLRNVRCGEFSRSNSHLFWCCGDIFLYYSGKKDAVWIGIKGFWDVIADSGSSFVAGIIADHMSVVSHDVHELSLPYSGSAGLFRIYIRIVLILRTLLPFIIRKDVHPVCYSDQYWNSNENGYSGCSIPSSAEVFIEN